MHIPRANVHAEHGTKDIKREKSVKAIQKHAKLQAEKS